MPGVPTSRGCEACRKQKKRCSQEQPACSRCARLAIPCVGGGARRFKFTENRTPADASVSQATPRDDNVNVTLVAPARALAGETTRLRASLVAMLEVKDARYNLGYYGGFFAHLPCRVGVNPALDAAVAAVTHSAPCLFKQQSSSLALEKYGRALYMLRLSLQQGGGVDLGIETLCTIYLLWISEDWITGNSEGHLMHTHVIALILKSLARRTDLDAFQAQLLRTLCMAVLVHSVFDPRVHLDEDVINRYLIAGPLLPRGSHLSSPFESLTVPNFARIPRLVHHPEHHRAQLLSVYARMASEFPNLRAIATSPTLQARKDAPLEAIRAQVNYQTAYGLFLAVAVMLNRLVLVTGVNGMDGEIERELEELCGEVQSLGERGLVLRPLGSHYMPMALSAAWAAIDEEGRRGQIERLARDYCPSDSLMAAWKARGMQIRWRFERARGLDKVDGVAVLEQGQAGLVTVD